MPNYRRVYIPGGTYFFTVRTYDHKQFLTSELARTSLRTAFDQTKAHYPFEILAISLLPDHIHTIWTLPEGDSDFSIRWRFLKATFSRCYKAGGGIEYDVSRSRRRRREVGYWERRFWEHVITDEEDLHRIMEYIYLNPVKHGYVNDPEDWDWTRIVVK
ncbi:transposase [bacterium]|nr:transposase [bacterium]